MLPWPQSAWPESVPYRRVWRNQPFPAGRGSCLLPCHRAAPTARASGQRQQCRCRCRRSFAALRRFAHQSLHFAYRFAQADKHRATDDGMADMQLTDSCQASHWLHVVVIQGMAGIEAHPKAADCLASLTNLVELNQNSRRLVIGPLVMEGM